MQQNKLSKTTDSHLSDLVGLEMAMTFSTHIMTPGVPFIITSAMETFPPKYDCHLAARNVSSYFVFLLWGNTGNTWCYIIMWDKDALIQQTRSILSRSCISCTWPIHKKNIFVINIIIKFCVHKKKSWIGTTNVTFEKQGHSNLWNFRFFLAESSGVLGCLSVGFWGVCSIAWADLTQSLTDLLLPSPVWRGKLSESRLLEVTAWLIFSPSDTWPEISSSVI